MTINIELLSFISAVDILRDLLALEAKYGPPPQSTPAIEQIVDYYKQVNLSIKLSTYLSIYLSIYLCIYLSIYL